MVLKRLIGGPAHNQEIDCDFPEFEFGLLQRKGKIVRTRYILDSYSRCGVTLEFYRYHELSRDSALKLLFNRKVAA